MKKCDQCKNLILTDYMDGELDKKLSEELESHLLDCGDCRVFFKEVRNRTVMPIQNVPQQPVPPELLAMIKQRIEDKAYAGSPLLDLFEKLKGVIVFPKIVPVFASFILMSLVGSVTLNTVQIQQAKDKDQGEYLLALLSTTGPSSDGDNNDVGTPIEHYFL